MIAEIVVSSIPELLAAPNLQEMMDAYAAEAALEGMPEPKANLDAYRAMDKWGLMHTLCAMVDGKIIGFILVLVNELPHYSALLASIESYFVLAQYRQSGAGIMLLKSAETHAFEKNAAGFMVSAACGGTLDKMMMRSMIYRKTHNVYFTGFHDA